MDHDLSFLELEIDQVLPKLTVKVKIESFKLIEALRIKERESFFNIGETKYLEVEKSLFSVKAVKCLNMMTGDDQKTDSHLGKLLEETQIDVKGTPNSLLEVSAQSS